MIAGIVEKDGTWAALVVSLAALVGYMLIKCRSDSLRRDELNREDARQATTALAALRKGITRNSEVLIAIKEILRGR
jgi:hypothetical protein